MPAVTLSLVMSATGHGLSCVADVPRTMSYTVHCDTSMPVDVANVTLLLDAPDRQVWEGVDICPRTCLSEDATLCT